VSFSDPWAPRTLVRTVAVLAACVVAVYLLYLLRDVVKIVAISVFTAVALGPLVDVVERRRVPRAWSIVVVYIALALGVVGIGLAIVPRSSSQLHKLSDQGRKAVSDFRANPTFHRYDQRYHLSAKLDDQLHRLPQRIGSLAGPLRDVTVGVFGFLANLVAVLSIAFVLLLNGRRYTQAVFDALPERHAGRCRRLAPQIYAAVSGYVLGNLVISVIAGTGAWLALTLLGVPFAAPLALLVAFLDLIPMIGATLAAAIVALVALLVSPAAALIWVVYAILYQQFENYVIQPLVYRRTVQVSALVTIVSVLAGGTLLGLLGALLAIPTAAVIQLAIADYRRIDDTSGGDRERSSEVGIEASSIA
jgi:predicted PurR-regulated permease PerM